MEEKDQRFVDICKHLYKGGASEDLIKETLMDLTLIHFPDLDPQGVRGHIHMVQSLVKTQERNLSQEIRDWISVSKGQFSVSECDRELGIVSQADKNNRRQVLFILTKEGILARHPKRTGIYRYIDGELDAMALVGEAPDPVDLRFPLGIHNLCKIYPGNIIVLAGSPDAGKTCFLLNLILLNMDVWNVHYFNSEMGEEELSMRLQHFSYPTKIDSWKFKAWSRATNFADVIQGGKGKLNIIDYLEIHDSFYEIGGMIADIYKVLKEAVCVIAIQKNTGAMFGRGGQITLEKPRLALAMDSGIMRIVKAKNWVDPKVRPAGMVRRFKIFNGSDLKADGDWHYEA